MIRAISELYDALQLLVSTASGIPPNAVILANQGRPAPSGLHATYNPVPVRAIGAPKRSRDDVAAEDCDIPGWTDFSETTVNQMEFLLSVNFFNEGSADAAARMHNANFRWPVLEMLHAHQIGWHGCSEVRTLTALVQAGIQPRHQVDVRLTVEIGITDTVLRAAGFAVTIYDESGNILYSGVSEQ